jgi:hypothetical protein
VHLPRDAEVQHLGAPRCRHDDVGGLEVAVDDAVRMRMASASASCSPNRTTVSIGNPPSNHCAERLASTISITSTGRPSSSTMSCSVQMWGD